LDSIMEKQPPSIFNDVIGPVMRGSSSSHTAASVRIGRIVKQCLSGPCRCCRVDFDPDGSLSSTYHEQGADIGLAGGLLGMDLSDPGLCTALETARQKNLDISFNITPFPADHPNTYRIRAASDKGEEMQLICLSTGGGMIDVQNINGFDVTIGGGFDETLLFYKNPDPGLLEKYSQIIAKLVPGYDYITTSKAGDQQLINLKTGHKVEDNQVKAIKDQTAPLKIIQFEPVLPVRSKKDYRVPFEGAGEAVTLAERDNLAMWELALRYESIRGGISESEVWQMACELARIMEQSVREGLAGTEYSNRILGSQSQLIFNHRSRLIGDELSAAIIANTSAVMETKSAFGVIVAAPTAGSCGTLPGTLTAVAGYKQLENDQIVKSLLAAGLVGVLIAGNSTFAAEECGCQAECGSASGMAAAGLVQMADGTVAEGFDAAAMALQNVMGMVCDPVAERVEVPCLGKNIMAGLNAVGCADMALAGFDRVIPLDETIGAMYSCGRMLPPELRCTGRGGLSVTETARAIYEKLNKET